MSHRPHRPEHASEDRHSGRLHEHGHGAPRDWGEAGARLEFEGEVAMPLLREAVDALASVTGSAEVRRIVDVGSGPGVASVLLAERFRSALVTAADTSPELLERAEHRAARFGVDDRFTTAIGDLEASLAEVAADASVDVVWASMVLHHLTELPSALLKVRGLLRPGGVLAVVEFGRHLHGQLPAGFDVGREGFVERHATAVRAAFEEHLPAGALSLDWPATLTAAGFDVLEHRELTRHLPAPLDAATRQCALQEFQTSAHRAPAHLDPADREVLAALADPGDRRCVVDRDDLSLHISRTLVLARRR